MASLADKIAAAELLTRLEAVEARVQYAEFSKSEVADQWRAIALSVALGFAVTILLMVGQQAGWLPELGWDTTPRFAATATAILALASLGHVGLKLMEVQAARRRENHKAELDRKG